MAERPANPYPGARPLEQGDATLLCGRESMLKRFVGAVKGYSVIELIGPSGVGKSSLVGAGFAGKLNKESGLVICPFSLWYQVEGSTGLHWYAHALALALDGRGRNLPDFRKDPYDYVMAVQRAFGSRLVVIFDQLEELLREDPDTGRTFLQNVADVARLVPEGYTQVVSARQEYKFELAIIEGQLEGRLWKYFPIGPVPDDAIPTIISNPLNAVGVHAANALVRALESAWVLAQPPPPELAQALAAPPKETVVGLLHLQAFLYAMFEAINPNSGDVINVDQVAEAMRIAFPTTLGEAQRFFASGLELYVDLVLNDKLEAHMAEHGDTDTTRLEATETLGIAAALPAYLSSGGFKLVQGTDELAAIVLTGFRDLHDSTAEATGEVTPFVADGTDDEQGETLARTLAWLFRKLNVPRDADMLESSALAKHPELSGWGDGSMTSGRMKNRSALRTACELVTMYERAIQWLSSSHIVRLAPARGDERMVSIVHDGFGRALNRWAAKVRARPTVRITSVVTMSGRQVLFQPATDEDALGPEALPFVDNLGWVGCNVTAHFKDLTFRNCDFRGSLFNRCRLTNVVFEDCVTHGLLFLNCTFTGDRGFVVRSVSPASEGAPSSRMQTFTMGRECVLEGGGVAFENLGGYGLFLDQVSGGPWRLEACGIEHIGIKGSRNGIGPGLIVRSPEIRNVSIVGAIDGVEVVDSGPIEHLSDPAGVVRYRQSGDAPPA
ncbi:MAG: hypothetical protein ACRDZ8_08340 [Acidimicrobiales bacterium]